MPCALPEAPPSGAPVPQGLSFGVMRREGTEGRSVAHAVGDSFQTIGDWRRLGVYLAPLLHFMCG